ncbi:hypothetical protein OEZ86_002273 [Tetradesmus obliquus]|nr:hypothetical protein OEZ86_002273 [Tetradesmus obliquus]
MWSCTIFVLALLVVAEGTPLQASRSNAHPGARSLLQLPVKTKLVQQPPAFMAGLAASCPPDDDCRDLRINFSYESSKKVFSDLVASGTFQFIDPNGCTGMLGGSCSATARIPYTDGIIKPITGTPTIVMGKGTGLHALKEVKAELRWGTAATCVPGTLPPPAVPSGTTMFYYGTKCQVVIFEYNAAKPSNICNHYFTGKTHAQINYDEKQPPNSKQSPKIQVWSCKDLVYDTGDCQTC